MKRSTRASLPKELQRMGSFPPTVEADLAVGLIWLGVAQEHHIGGEAAHINDKRAGGLLQQRRLGYHCRVASPLVAKADFILNQQANAIGYELLGSAQLLKSPHQKTGEGLAES